MRFILPNLIEYCRKLFYSKEKSKFFGKSSKEVFTEIYKKNHWKDSESISGRGSTVKQTEFILNAITDIIRNYNIKRVTDIPCGDFNWMRNLDFTSIDYFGGDIVEALILKNISEFENHSNIEFKVFDLISEVPPQSDLIIIRDCFVHFSFSDLYKALLNLKRSNSKYLLTTTFPLHKINFDIATGDWRTLNLNLSPFGFPAPTLLINEHYKEPSGIFKDKSLGLWEIEKLNLTELKSIRN